MFPWLWREECVSYLKMSSHSIALPPPGLGGSPLLGPLTTTNLSSCASTWQRHHQCTRLLTVFLFWWVISFRRAGAIFPGPTTESAVWSAWLAYEAMDKRLCENMCMHVCVEVHCVCVCTWIGRWEHGSWNVCEWYVLGNSRYLLHSGPFMEVNRLLLPNPASW